MAKVLNFNTVERPTLELIMQDDAQTLIQVGTPTEGLVEELSAMAPQLDKVLQAQDAESIKAIYDLAARLINCNRNFVKVTAEELRDRYRMNFESLVLFYGAYIEFLDDIMKAKN